MSDYTEAIFERKLIELRDSQKEIQSLSQYCVHNRQHCKSVVKVWYKNIKTTAVTRKLTAMYLANDVVQNSKKRGPEYAQEFGMVMRKVFEHLAVMDFNDKTIMSLVRLIGIWQERQIFDKKILHEISKIWDQKHKNSGAANVAGLDSESPKKRRESSGSGTERRKSREIAEIEDLLDASMQASETSDAQEETLTLSPRQGGSPGSGDPPEPEELIQALQDLENSASSDAIVREKIAKLPPEVSEVARIESLQSVAEAKVLNGQVEEASTLLDDYNLRLQEELKDRKKVGSMISEFLSAQKDLLAQAEERLELYLDKLDKIHGVKDELKSHIAALPDIPVLPASTGLAPLPSAGDLFTH
eukprot:TRINITY_DN6332_c0_g1_i2.p1 TRINITY_DN6332_c0_g1~~TRINITY_DN6332_c0_g1_i2.p1  ORF type:complete len:376 (+),score=117.16 TRINITY_DN6332_c0_g1_i2:52-1128(+)